METREGREAALAYICESLAARAHEGKRDLQRDASLALRILDYLMTEERGKRATEVSGVQGGGRAELRVCREEEPRIINFERAKAAILARRARRDLVSCEGRVEMERPRLRIFRAD